ncbi:hypothetical protein SIID45300_01766 [Candidatus Magnetaquicoccaceae bacterium FCR-1]|uniref:Mu-like prophage protein gp16 n=1 Tax=Candidatus Magnetaquiglobus chichijimensis TaxID=3141448 RepID=A0ABQ0C970_9PROT
MSMRATKLIAKIHIAKVQLGLDDNAYRALLESCTGKASCKEMTDRELRGVLREFERRGWKPAPPKPEAPPVGIEIPPGSRWMARPSNWDDPEKRGMYAKIYAMICANKIHDWSWGYVRGTAKKMFEKTRGDVVLEFLSVAELHKLTSALAIHSWRLKQRPA